MAVVVSIIRNSHSYFDVLENQDQTNFLQLLTGNVSQAALSVVTDELVKAHKLCKNDNMNE